MREVERFDKKICSYIYDKRLYEIIIKMVSSYNTKKIIKAGCLYSLSVGVIGAVATDAPALAGIWGTMIYNIAKEHEYTITKSNCVKVCASVLASASSWMTGCAVLTKILTYTGVGLVLGVGINCCVNAFYTFRLGKTFDAIFKDESQLDAYVTLTKVLIRHLVPFPSWNEVKECVSLIKD